MATMPAMRARITMPLSDCDKRNFEMASIENTYAQIAEFAQKHGARRVTLFGSRARGDSKPKSDIDIAVEGCSNYAAFAEDVQEHLWSLLQVDIVNLDDPVSSDLRGSIARDGKVIYEAL